MSRQPEFFSNRDTPAAMLRHRTGKLSLDQPGGFQFSRHPTQHFGPPSGGLSELPVSKH